MKRFLFLFLLFTPFFNSAQIIEPAPENKAVVYFVRPSSVGWAINFTYFDSTQVIGRFNGVKFLRYECDPGKHIFWARSENKDFISGQFEAGKIYLIEAVPYMGALKAGVRLYPIESTEYLKQIQKLLTKGKSEEFSEEELESLQYEMEFVIERGVIQN